ncbi:MAG: hypothetical protein AAFV53_06730 [Myxococcota bacterium]
MSRVWLVIAMTTLGCNENEFSIVRQDNADRFTQTEAGAADILLVVDNSCSMEPFQQKLASNFDTFLTFFLEGDVDYQIGVVTTTVDAVDPRLSDCSVSELDAVTVGGALVDGQIITASTPSASETFSDIVNVGTCGAGTEMGLEAAARALSDGNNPGFVRDDATLSLIFVSDEQDVSPLPINQYLNTYRSAKATVDRRPPLNISALVVDDIGQCSASQIEQGASEGSRYVDVAEQASGVVVNICNDDFAEIVTELSLNSSGLEDTFVLSRLPSPSSIRVAVAGEDIPCESGAWRYDLRIGEQAVIIFDRSALPPPFAEIEVEYNDGDGDPFLFCPEAR